MRISLYARCRYFRKTFMISHCQARIRPASRRGIIGNFKSLVNYNEQVRLGGVLGQKIETQDCPPWSPAQAQR